MIAFKPGGRAVCIGEVMVELAREADGRYAPRFGGDTFNTAVYLARSGAAASYATALGDDQFSDAIQALAEAEGVGTEAILRAANRVPGLYLIHTDEAGERTFLYWRDTSPARELFRLEGHARVVRAIEDAGLVYLSGISLSLYTPEQLETLFAAIETARGRGAIVAIDTNYRPRNWGGDRARAQRTIRRATKLAHIALPTFDDEGLLWGDTRIEETRARFQEAGCEEVVIKDGPGGAHVSVGSLTDHVPVPDSVTPVDTTAAGDSFNAGYLAARMRGEDAFTAAQSGHRLAGVVIRHPGAIVPRAATDAVTGRA
ncbi:MAG: sugar kinase [Pseudomonadota bacterium]